VFGSHKPNTFFLSTEQPENPTERIIIYNFPTFAARLGSVCHFLYVIKFLLTYYIFMSTDFLSSDFDAVAIVLGCLFLVFVIGILVWKNDIKNIRKDK